MSFRIDPDRPIRRNLRRLARHQLDNAEVRDAARELSSLRDAHAVLGSFDHVIAATHGDRPPGDALERVRAGLLRHSARAEPADAAVLLERARDHLARVRRRAKYGWHHVELLHVVAPSVLGPMAGRLKDLSDGLGDDHDLAVLRATRLGSRLYAEPPPALRRRMGRYWAAWHALGRERPVGEIADLVREPADRLPDVADLLVDGARV
jgi:hypothetical protein